MFWASLITIWCRRVQVGSNLGKLTIEIKWKGQKLVLSSLRRSVVKRNFTREVDAIHVQNNIVDWDKEFQSICSHLAYKDNLFHPWEISFILFNLSLSLLELRTAIEIVEPVQRSIVPAPSGPSPRPSVETASTEKYEPFLSIFNIETRHEDSYANGSPVSEFEDDDFAIGT